MLVKLRVAIITCLAFTGVLPVLADQTAPLPISAPTQTSGSIVTFQDKHARASFLVDNNLKLNQLHYKSQLGAYVAPRVPGQLVSGHGVKVSPDRTYRVMQTPNDPLYSQQSWYFNALNAPAGWDITTGSASVIIADIDTGFAVNQQDLANKWWTNSAEMGSTTNEGPTPNCVSQGLTPDKSCNNLDNDGDGYPSDWRGWDFVDNSNDVSAGKTDPTSPYVGHGTATASLLAASTNDGTGMAGMCWACKIMPIQALGDNGIGDTANIASAVDYAVSHGASVINMSLGSTTSDPTLQTAVENAISKGVIVVAAAGNGGPGDIEYPASYQGVIAVGATDSNNQLASFTSTGTPISVVAPGVNVLVDTWTQSNQTSATALENGTSMASPLVAGLAGLLHSEVPTASPGNIREALQTNGSAVVNSGQTYTLPNAFSALTVINSTHPDGTLIQQPGNSAIYLVSSGKLDYVPTPAVFNSWGFNWSSIKAANLGDLSLPTGNNLGLRSGTLIQPVGSPSIYIVDTSQGYTKRYIADMSVFNGLGYNTSNILSVGLGDVPSQNGSSITDASSHPDGSLVSSGSSIYQISGGQLDYIPSPSIFDSQGFSWQGIEPATSADMSLPQGAQVELRSGVVAKGSSSAIYIINGYQGYTKRYVPTMSVFAAYGYDSADVMAIPDSELPAQNGPDL